MLLNSVILEGYLSAKTIVDDKCVISLRMSKDDSKPLRCEIEDPKLRKAIEDRETMALIRVVGSVEIRSTYGDYLTYIEVKHIEFKSKV